MRLGLSTSLLGKNPKEWAETLQQAGCGSVVFPVDCSASDELINEYAACAYNKGLTIAEVGIWRNAISVDAEEQKKNLEYSIKQLELADRIGACCCVNVAGSVGKRWDGAYKENCSKETWDRTVKMIQEVIDEVNPKNTYFSIEPMPWMIPDSPQKYVELLEDVARDRFAVHMDIINMVNCPQRYFFQEEFLEETFSLLGRKIKSCHLKDVKLKEEFTFQLQECAPGEGSFNLEKYAELANKFNPQMPMIIEHLKNDSDYFKSLKYVIERLS